MKQKTGFQLVQAVLFMLAMLGGGLLLLPGSDVFNESECLSMESPVSGQNGNWMLRPSSKSCTE